VKNKSVTFSLVRADDPVMFSNVVADTFLRFKGLGRFFVVIGTWRGGSPFMLGYGMIDFPCA
jgi:hypothetical protein